MKLKLFLSIIMLFQSLQLFAIEPYEKGLLLYSKQTSNVVFCKSGKCLEVPLYQEVGNGFELFQNGNNQYLIKGLKDWFVWDVKKGTVKPIGNVSTYNGVSFYLKDELSIGFNHKFAKTEIVIKKGKEKTFTGYKNMKTLKFNFLPDGKHIFVVIPGMGKGESPYFIDILDQSSQALYYAKDLGAKPEKVAELPKGDGFMDPHLVNQGKNVVFWRPGGFDEKEEMRTLHLDSLDMKTKIINRLYTMKIDYKKGHYYRGLPDAFYFANGPYVLIPQEFSMRSKTKRFVLIQVEENTKQEVLEQRQKIVLPIAPNILMYPLKLIYPSNYLIVQTYSNGAVYKVLNNKDLSIIEEFPLKLIRGNFQGDYIE